MTTFDDSQDEITKALDAETLRRSKEKDREQFTPFKKQPHITINVLGIDAIIPIVGMMPDYCAMCKQKASDYVVDCECLCHSNWSDMNRF